MISFDILYSEDNTLSTSFLSYFDKFIIGSSRRADIVILDSMVAPLHIKLEVKENALICKSFSDEQSFNVNGKKYKGSKVIKVNDELLIGNTHLKITNIAQMEIAPDDQLQELYQSAITKIPELKEIITELKKEIQYLERPENVQE
jgi:hypothetical protein